LEWDLAARRALFKGHRLETWNRPLGLPEGFLKATKDDLQGFYSRHYVPANISLVVVGGFKTEEVITELEKSPFGKMKDGRRNPIPEPFDHIPTPREHERMVKLSDHFSFKVDQTEYRATWAFPGSFPRQARKVFSIVLSEVLFDQIRQKRGLAYSIGSSFTSFQDICEFSIQGSVRPEVTLDINGLVGECIDMVPSRPDLFERKLRSCIQRCFMTDLSGEELGDTSADWLSMHHRIITIQETLRELHLVTFEQMAEAAALLSPEKQYTFITSP
jgi:predicted Zn-dependent peptidase